MALPSVKFDPETEEIEVVSSERKKLDIHGLPAVTSFALYKHNQRYYINIIIVNVNLTRQIENPSISGNQL